MNKWIKGRSGGLLMPMMASARLERSTLGWKVAAGWTRLRKSMRAGGIAIALQGKNHGMKAGMVR
jgi:hypothetical protein